MPRRIHDANLETRTARSRLQIREKPYYRALDEGVHLGYRKGKRGGKWLVRLYVGGQDYRFETLDALPDDHTEADGVAVLSYGQAQAAARQRFAAAKRAAKGLPDGCYTVRDAVESYLTWLDANRRSGHDSRCRAEAHILPELGGIALADLTGTRLQSWLDKLATSPARLRSAEGLQHYRAAPGKDDPEGRRRRRSSANRTWTVLRAALNRAWRANQVDSDAAWRKVETFRDADAARLRFLTADECRRLINASQGAFRALVQAALATGCRYGELRALEVGDFNAERGLLHVRQSKTGKGRHIVLNNEGVALFCRLTVGRLGSEPLLRKDSGAEWHRSEQCAPIAEASHRAGLAPAVNFHALRHTYASLAVMNGMPLLVVAKTLGHTSTEMVERHYGHLSNDYYAKAVRAAAPEFGVEEAEVVTPITASRVV
jgi:integrase